MSESKDPVVFLIILLERKVSMFLEIHFLMCHSAASLHTFICILFVEYAVMYFLLNSTYRFAQFCFYICSISRSKPLYLKKALGIRGILSHPTAHTDAVSCSNFNFCHRRQFVHLNLFLFIYSIFCIRHFFFSICKCNWRINVVPHLWDHSLDASHLHVFKFHGFDWFLRWVLTCVGVI